MNMWDYQSNIRLQIPVWTESLHNDMSWISPLSVGTISTGINLDSTQCTLLIFPFQTFFLGEMINHWISIEGEILSGFYFNIRIWRKVHFFGNVKVSKAINDDEHVSIFLCEMFQCRWSWFERVMSSVHLSTSSLLQNKTCFSYFREMHLFKPHEILRSLTDLKIYWFNCVLIFLANVWFALRLKCFLKHHILIYNVSH